MAQRKTTSRTGKHTSKRQRRPCVLSHATALSVWFSPSAPTVDGTRTQLISLDGVASTWGEVCAANAARLIPKRDAKVVDLHVLCGEKPPRSRKGEAIFHQRLGTVPLGSICDFGGGVYVVAPELCFAQVASALPLEVLVELGNNLCAQYAIDDDGIRWREPLTTRAKIEATLDALPNEAARRARTALRYVSDGSGSPTESTVAAMLRIPKRAGGFGLPTFSMNRRMDLNQLARELSGRTYLVFDMFWEELMVALEDDSNAYHAGDSWGSAIVDGQDWRLKERSAAEKIEQDSRRRAAALEMGVTLVTLTSNELHDLTTFSAKATQLRRQLGLRTRRVKQAEIEKRRAVHEHLFFETRYMVGQAARVERFVQRRVYDRKHSAA